MTRARIILAGLVPILLASPARAGDVADGTKAEAEQAIQAYFAMWSKDAGVTRDAVDRFYAPRTVYYGHSFSRAQILADKLAYIKHWPQRSYTEVPNSLTAHCNADRSLCTVAVDMVWRRTSWRPAAWQRTGVRMVSGEAHMVFDFVPGDGGRKIAREAARNL